MASKIFAWGLGLLFYGALAVYCFDSTNSDGNRAVAAMIACLFYIRHEFYEQEKRMQKLVEKIEDRLDKREQTYDMPGYIESEER